MNLTIFQMDIAWKDIPGNINKIDDTCTLLKGNTDMIICPEMFNTGYIMDPASDLNLFQTDTIRQLQSISKKSGITIAGSIPVCRDGKFYNDFVFINQNGMQFSYSKIHLFTPAGEAEQYNHGNDANDYKFKGTKIRPLICYDLRFPYCSFNTTGYDILIYTANWPKSRISHWKKLLIARAIENQCFVIGVNRVGEDKNGFEYPGCSMVIGFDGEIIIELGDEEIWSTFQPDFDSLNTYRTKLPFLKDIRIK